MHPGSDRYPGYRDQADVESSIAFRVFLLVFVACGFGFRAWFPGLGLVTIIGLAGLVGAAVSFLAGQGMARVHKRRREAGAAEYRAMTEADTQKKIDAMRRANEENEG